MTDEPQHHHLEPPPTLALGLSNTNHKTAFPTRRVSIDALARHILAGRAFAVGTYKHGYRSKANAIAVQVIALDLDTGNVSRDELLSNAFVAQYCAILYHTPNSGKVNKKNPTGGDRWRAVFVLSEPVPPDAWEELALAVVAHTGLEVDGASWDRARMFAGSTNRIEAAHVNTAAVLPLAVAGALTYERAAAECEAEMQRRKLAEQLAALPPRPNSGARLEKYVASAVDGEIATINSAGPGTRNDTLNIGVHSLGTLEASPWAQPYISRYDIPRLAFDAATANGYVAEHGERATWATINSALNAGRKKPRPEPAARELPARPPAAAPEPVAPEQVPNAQNPTFHQWGEAGLPDSWRSAFLNYLPAAAPLAELCNEAARAGLIDADAFTVAELAQAAQTLNTGVTHNALWRAVNRVGDELIAKQGTITDTNIGSDFAINPPNGRPAQVFALKPLADVRDYLLRCATPRIYERAHPTEPAPDGTRPAVFAQWTPARLVDLSYEGPAAVDASHDLNQWFAPAFDEQGELGARALTRAKKQRARLLLRLGEPHSTPLPAGWPLGSVADFRATFLRAIHAENPQMSRRTIANLLGIADSSVDGVLARAGLQNTGEAQFELRPLTAPADTDAISRQVTRLGRDVRGYPRFVTRRHADGSTDAPIAYTPENARVLVLDAAANGAEVVVHFQVANVQEIVRDTPPEPRRREPEPAHDAGSGAPAEAPEKGTDMKPTEQAMTPPDVEQASYHGPHYNPAWQAKQILLGLRLMGWLQPDGRYVCPETGEVVAPDASVDELLSVVLERAQAHRKAAPPPLSTLDFCTLEAAELRAEVHPIGEPAR